MRRRLAALVLAVVAAGALHARAADSSYHYLNAAQLDLTVLLPPPPDTGSPQEDADERAVAKTVAERNPTQMQGAMLNSARTVFFFAPSVGASFTAARDPATAAFFGRIGDDVEGLIHETKAYWQRPRPDGVVKKHGSYPSGHAAFAAAAAIVLARLLPCKRDAIFNQARTFAENRIVLGVHYPSDIAAGWTAGTLAAYVMMQNAGFERDFADAKTELRGVCPA